jgi:hypothetical protein
VAFHKTVLMRKNSKILYHFPNYHMKILLGDFDIQLQKGDIIKPTIGHDSLHQESNRVKQY